MPLLRKLSSILYTSSVFRIGQTTATALNTDSPGTSTRQPWEVPTFYQRHDPLFLDLCSALPSPNGSSRNQEITSPVATTVGVIRLLIRSLLE